MTGVPPTLNVLGSPHDVMGKVLDCGLEVSEFEFQLCYYIHFQTYAIRKGMNLLIPPPSYGLDSITALRPQ